MLEASGETSLAVPLRDLFGHDGFRPGQREIIERVLAGDDVLAVLPTGGGKSLLYQLPALLLPGATVAVSPLISLMKDQVDQLRARGLPAALLNSSQDLGEQDRILAALSRGELKLLYVAPERFKSTRFLAALGRLRVSLLAVDEAHCVSEWGHDFRPDYLKLAEARALLGSPPVLAVTATATDRVRQEIARGLGLRPERRVFVEGFDRPNLRFSAVACSGEAEKEAAVKAALARRSEGAAIVYAATRKNCERLAHRIPGALLYHAGLGKDERRKAQERWSSGERPVVVATNAFGLGINKEDVRLVVHHDLPGSLEAYYQEAGRAGRDGDPAECVLVFSSADAHLQTFLAESAFPERAVVESVWRALLARRGSDPATIRDALRAENPSERAVASAMKLLVEAGHASQDRDGEVEPLVERLGESPEELRIDWARLTRLRERERERLDDMLRYARGTLCRRAAILRYFGAPMAPCGRCDRCSILATDSLPADEAKTVARKVLSLVARLRGRFGRTVVARLLAGVVTREDRERRLDALPTVGALRPWSQADCATAVDACLGHGLLATSTEDGKYPKLVLTALGVSVLFDRESVPLALARPGTAAPPAGGRGAKKEKKKKRAPARGPGGTESPHAAADPAPDSGLLAALRAWRTARSREDRVPPYCIFHDRTLEAIALARPHDHVSLLEVPGLGPKKAERYGEHVLSLVSAAVRA
jgi:ATP-dependent DNA helicase RecQ